ncbi:MAG TPA: ubiquinol oxidase subunit II [Candidatus Saccharimonadales bacterium]|nr:ubiquinol oxidase subunit II [Candidatus Saccharimonadales bacterium]
MRKTAKILAIVIPVAALVGWLTWYLRRHSVAVLQPTGELGHKELHLIILACLLAIIVVVPTFALTIFIALRYRESNHQKSHKKITYSPDFDHSRLFETIWWGIPIIIITILSVVTWQSSHALDPYKALASKHKPLVIEVVALDWKWLFIYPEQHVAVVNMAEIPTNVPINFHVTSDAVMNSFWIPQLGGQVYAMPGMDTQLHELADQPGSFFGSPANIAGSGYARMDFTVKAVSQSQFKAWANDVKQVAPQLTMADYQALTKPSQSVPITFYADTPRGLYDTILLKYMMPHVTNFGDNQG